MAHPSFFKYPGLFLNSPDKIPTTQNPFISLFTLPLLPTKKARLVITGTSD